MDAFAPSDLKTILHSKRANLYYLQHCRVLVKGGRVEYVTDEGSHSLYWNIPIANSTVLLLGTGTSITQAAMRELAKAGVMVVFSGGGGTPLYSASEMDIEVAWFSPQSEYRPIINSVEKIIMYMDVVYDLLTAVDKVSHVTDLPIERYGGLDIMPKDDRGFAVEARNISYVFPDGRFQLQDINLQIAPGERICIASPGGSGKTVLTSMLTGLYTDYQGSVTLDGYSLRDLDLAHLREKIAKNISVEDLFDGTILENLSVGNPHTTADRVLGALHKVGLADTIHAMPEGLSTHKSQS